MIFICKNEDCSSTPCKFVLDGDGYATPDVCPYEIAKAMWEEEKEKIDDDDDDDYRKEALTPAQRNR